MTTYHNASADLERTGTQTYEDVTAEVKCGQMKAQ